jgi:hypothetical protein
MAQLLEKELGDCTIFSAAVSGKGRKPTTDITIRFSQSV